MAHKVDLYNIIIQARMGSVRFPGKSMYFFNARPALSYLIDALLQCIDRARICVVTSERKENDCIRDFCRAEHIEVYSGSEQNVASRFYEVLQKKRCHRFVRLSGDSPLFDYRLLEKALYAFPDRCDVYSSIYTERYPSGMNFEIIQRSTFLNAYPLFTKEEDFEHVTRYFYTHDKHYLIIQAPALNVVPMTACRFSFDTAGDAQRINAFFQSIDKPHYSYSFQKKLEIMRKLEKDNAYA